MDLGGLDSLSISSCLKVRSVYGTGVLLPSLGQGGGIVYGIVLCEAGAQVDPDRFG